MLSLYLEMITFLIKIVKNVSEVQDKSQNSEIYIEKTQLPSPRLLQDPWSAI